jgi:NAD dependent epimerase/dehydratase
MVKSLITGADGFIGSHLAEMLIAEGHEVRALSQYNSFNHWGWLEDINHSKDIEILTGDIRDPHFCRNITKGIDVVFHLAALIAIPYSYVAPDCYIDTNVKGTLNICQAAIDNGVRRVIHTSTSEVYGTARYVPMDEKHPLQAQSPYSASKIGADAIAMSFFNAFDLPLTIARPFNTYGPRQSARAIIPSVITQIASGRKTIEVGDLTPTRDFNFVTDTCRGFVELARCDQAIGETVNISTNSEVSIKAVLELIRELMGSMVEFLPQEQRMRPARSEVFRLWGNNTKMRELTGFAPAHDLRSGLRATVDWFTDPSKLARYKTGIYNV